MNQVLAAARREVIRAGRSVVEFVNGDCVAVLDALRPAGVDVIVTSPPYNLGIEYEVYDDSISREDYLKWSLRWLGSAERALSHAGSLFLNMGGKPTNPLGPEQVLLQAIEAGFVLQNRIFWVKSVAVRIKTKARLIRQAAEKAGLDEKATRALVKSFAELEGDDGLVRTCGHFKSLNTPRFVNDTVEMVYHLTRSGDVPVDKLAVGVEYEVKANLTRDTRGKNGDIRCRGNAVWAPYETIQSREDDRPHPATFPVELAEYCFKLHGLDRIRVTMDPFSGLGNSAVAAARLGLNHVGIELGPKTHDEAVRRFREEFDQKGEQS